MENAKYGISSKFTSSASKALFRVGSPESPAYVLKGQGEGDREWPPFGIGKEEERVGLRGMG